MIAVTGGNNGHQNVALRDLSLDGGLVANGLFLLNVLRGEVSEIYCVHFLTAGVTVEKGHEVALRDRVRPAPPRARVPAGDTHRALPSRSGVRE